MSLNNFLCYLQQLLSMVDGSDEESVALAQSALAATIRMVRFSGKADRITWQTMTAAEGMFPHLVEHREDYSGVPGEYLRNERRRRRLGMVLQPHC